MPQWTSGSWKNRQGARALLAFLLLALGFVPSVLPETAEGAANPVPVLSLRLDAAGQNARVTGSAPGLVQFTGQAAIDKLPAERCLVTLTASTDTGWAAQVSPSTAVFTSTTPQSFTCTVVVPPGTAGNLTGNLTIRGRADTCGLRSLAGVAAIITVDPYFKVEVYSKQPIMEILPGEQAHFTVWIRNQGNSVDFFDKGIENLRTLSNSRWTVILCACLPGRTLPGEEKPVRVTVQSPRDDPFAPESITTIEFRSASLYARDFQQTVSGTIQLTVHVRAGLNLNLSLSLLALALSVDAAIFVVFFGRQGTRRCI